VPLDTRALLREASHLEPLPQATVRLVAIFARDDWEAAEVLEVIRLDPVLTGKVLGAANAASAGARHPILNLGEAVRRIGPRAVVGLAIAAGARHCLAQALPQLGLGEGELWRHSVAALIATEVASPHFGLPFSSVAATAALLHDVGKVLLVRVLDPETRDYLRLACLEGGRSLAQAEHEVLALSHAELGALVAAHWGLPEPIVAAIRHHHDLGGAPLEARYDVALVQLAEASAHEVAPPLLRGARDPDETAGALAHLVLSPERLPAFHAGVRARFERVGSAY